MIYYTTMPFQYELRREMSILALSMSHPVANTVILSISAMQITR